MIARVSVAALTGVLAVVLLAFAVADVRSDLASGGAERIASAPGDARAASGLGERVAGFARMLGEAGDGAASNGPSPLRVALRALPTTVGLCLSAWVIALLAGIPLGVWAALEHAGKLRVLLRTMLVIAASVPVAGAVVLLERGLVAGHGHASAAGVPLGSVLALALPACAIVADRAASRTLRLMEADPIRGLAALGVSAAERLARVGHALMVAQSRSGFHLLAVLLAGAVVTEGPFGAQGVGRLTLDAARDGDPALFAASVLLLGVTSVIIDVAGRLVAIGLAPDARGQGLP